jgi:TonB family protein
MNSRRRARWWSRIGWTFSVCFLFAVQFYAVVWLARVPAASAAVARTGPTTRLWIPHDPIEEQSLPGRSRLPAVARSEVLSFSRAAEQALPKPQYRLDEVAATPQWLTADSGLHLASPVAPVRIPARAATPDSLPESSIRPVTVGQMATQTVMTVKGDLSRRSWETTPRWPVRTNSDPLRPTVIEVAVNPRGDVLVPTLLFSSGDKAADAAALETIRQAKFKPLAGTPDDSLTWGRLLIQWVTAPPQAAATLR